MTCPNKPTHCLIHHHWPHGATSFPAAVASQYLLDQIHNLPIHLRCLNFLTNQNTYSLPGSWWKHVLVLLWSCFGWFAASANSSWKMFPLVEAQRRDRSNLLTFPGNCAAKQSEKRRQFGPNVQTLKLWQYYTFMPYFFLKSHYISLKKYLFSIFFFFQCSIIIIDPRADF